MTEAYALSPRAAGRLAELMRRQPGGGIARGTGGGSTVDVQFVTCLSATAAGDSGVLAECYPAQIILPACDTALPAEADEVGLVLLTVFADDGTAGVPTADAVYLCVVSDDTPGDGTGSFAGRPRAFGVSRLTALGAYRTIPMYDETTTGLTPSGFESSEDGNPLASAYELYGQPDLITAADFLGISLIPGWGGSWLVAYNAAGFGLYEPGGRFAAQRLFAKEYGTHVDGETDVRVGYLGLVTTGGLSFANGMYVGGSFTGLTDPGDGITGATYP